MSFNGIGPAVGGDGIARSDVISATTNYSTAVGYGDLYPESASSAANGVSVAATGTNGSANIATNAQLAQLLKTTSYGSPDAVGNTSAALERKKSLKR